MTVSVHSPAELIAVIPHLLGFKPEESIVFLPIRSDLPIARVDLPTTPRDRELVWRSIRDGFSRYARPGAGADLVGQEFADRLDTIGIGGLLRRPRRSPG